jgi:hypothetical protein
MTRARPSSLLRLVAALSVLAVVAVGCSSKKSTVPTATTPGVTSTISPPAATPPAAASGLSGTWSGEYNGASQGTFTLTWQQSGSDLAGTINISEIGSPVDIKGTVDGNKISFGTVGGAGVTYSGTVSGKTMSGTYQSSTGNGNWTATKTS